MPVSCHLLFFSSNSPLNCNSAKGIPCNCSSSSADRIGLCISEETRGKRSERRGVEKRNREDGGHEEERSAPHYWREEKGGREKEDAGDQVHKGGHGGRETQDRWGLQWGQTASRGQLEVRLLSVVWVLLVHALTEFVAHERLVHVKRHKWVEVTSACMPSSDTSD